MASACAAPERDDAIREDVVRAGTCTLCGTPIMFTIETAHSAYLIGRGVCGCFEGQMLIRNPDL